MPSLFSTEASQALGALPLGPISAFLSSCTWALGSGVYSRLSHAHSAFAINFTRALFALPLFFGAAVFSQGLNSLASIEAHHLAWLTLSMVASYGIADAFFLASTRALGVPGALSIASLYPAWTVLLGVMKGERLLSAREGMGLVLTLFGVFYTLRVGKSVRESVQAEQSSDQIRTGVLFAVVTSFLWALNSFSVVQGAQGLSLHWVNVIRMSAALLICGLLGLISQKRAGAPGWRPGLSLSDIGRNGWVFPVEAFGGSLFFAYGLANSPLVVGATLSSLAPILSVPLAWVAGDEKFSLKRGLGVALVTLGLTLLLGV